MLPSNGEPGTPRGQMFTKLGQKLAFHRRQTAQSGSKVCKTDVERTRRHLLRHMASIGTTSPRAPAPYVTTWGRPRGRQYVVDPSE